MPFYLYFSPNCHVAVADPGFPVGGGGGVDLQRGHFLVKMYAKTKELGPIGGGVRRARPPRSANALLSEKHLPVHWIKIHEAINICADIFLNSTSPQISPSGKICRNVPSTIIIDMTAIHYLYILSGYIH